MRATPALNGLKKRDKNIDHIVRCQKKNFHKNFMLLFELKLHIIFVDKNQK